jgi:hypothetical protein
MKFQAGYTPSFEIVCENAQDEMWMRTFLTNLYRELKEKDKKYLVTLEKMFSIHIEDCIPPYCTLTEFGKESESECGAEFPDRIEFSVDF